MKIRRNAPWQLAILIDFAKSLPEASKWCKKAGGRAKQVGSRHHWH
jgi:hypothetical protein